VVRVGLEKGIPCCKEVFVPPGASGEDQDGLLKLLAAIECGSPIHQTRHVSECLCAYGNTV